MKRTARMESSAWFWSRFIAGFRVLSAVRVENGFLEHFAVFNQSAVSLAAAQGCSIPRCFQLDSTYSILSPSTFLSSRLQTVSTSERNIGVKYVVSQMTEAASSSCAKYARDSPPQPVLERCIEELPITQIQTVANH